MVRISDIRIGVKLAVVSALGVLLVAGMLVAWLYSYEQIKAANEPALLQRNIVHDLDRLELPANAMKERVAAFRINDAGMASSGGHYRPAGGMKAPAVATLPKRAAPTRLVSAGGGAAQVREF